MSARDGEAKGRVLVYVRGGKLWYAVYGRGSKLCMYGRIVELEDCNLYNALCLLPRIADKYWEARKIELCSCGCQEWIEDMMKAAARLSKKISLSSCCWW